MSIRGSTTRTLLPVIQRRSQRWLCSQGPCAHMAPGAFLPNAASGVFMPGISFPHGWTCCCRRCTEQPGSLRTSLLLTIPGLQRIQVLQIHPESTSVFPSIDQGMVLTMARVFSKILGKLSEIRYSLPAYCPKVLYQ